MLEARLLTPKDYQVQPWKNGRGETNQIAVDGETPFRWRVSWVPLTESGSFSAYPGYDRSLVLLTGGPIVLTHDGKRQRDLKPMMAHSFKGEWETQAIVGLPAEDFNVFTATGRARASVHPTFFRAGEEMQFPLAGQEHFLFGVENETEILESHHNRKFTLKPRETFRASRAGEQEFLNLRAKGISGTASCIWVVIYLGDA